MSPKRTTKPGKGLSRPQKIKALMNYFGISRAEAIAMLEDMGE